MDHINKAVSQGDGKFYIRIRINGVAIFWELNRYNKKIADVWFVECSNERTLIFPEGDKVLHSQYGWNS